MPLRDIHLPEAIGLWPLAPGWWLVIGLAVLALGWLVARAWRRWQFDAPRRQALRSLAAVEAEYLSHRDPVRLAKAVSSLLRRGMLAYAPRGEVAGLTGEDWLRWLDDGLQVPYFHTEGGRSLLHLPYRDPDGDYNDVDVHALLSAVRMRLATPQKVAA